MACKNLSKIAPRSWRVLRWFGVPALLMTLAACGGGSGGSSMSTPQACGGMTSCGTAMITLTDAPGDFTSYAVDITSLTLTKTNGAVVETLPVTTHVDLAQLVNVTELVSAGQIPAGEYASASITVDYSHAAVFVENGSGTSVQATLVDGSGNPLTTLTLTVKLDDAHHFFIEPGAISHLALDFNLPASNSVDLSKTPPVVTVQPFIVASVEPSTMINTRVRGTLASVDTAGSSYVVNLQPFDDDDQEDGMGQATVHVTAATTFEINGTGATGAAGLTALAALPAGTMTVAFGTLSTTDHSFTANQVLAGSSVTMPSMDTLYGVVIARSMNSLTVRGATLAMWDSGGDEFSPKDVTLSTGSGTMITVAGQPGATPTLAAPSVGSKITAFGKVGTDSSGNPTFDATAGRVRLEITRIWGYATAVASGTVTLNLQQIGNLPASAFNFAGTGTSSAQDTSASHYLVATGALPPPTPSATTPVRFLGFVQPFGSAPPDFNAITQVDYSAAIAVLDADFGAGSSAAFSTLSPTEMVLNLSDPLLGMEHAIRLGPAIIDLTKLASSPPILPATSGMDLFAIKKWSGDDSETVSAYQTYAAFETALSGMLSGTTKVVRVLAVGSYDPVANTFTATQIAVVVTG
jgi:hypothetical protein